MREQVFICYFKKDAKWLEDLKRHLKPLLRQRPLTIWDETMIKPGQKWQEEIKHAIAEAKVAVLLVSSDFLASDFIAEQQLPSLLDAAKNDGLTILWIAVRACSYQATAIERYQALNDASRPLSKLRLNQREELLSRMSEQIIEIADQDINRKELERSIPPLVVYEDVIGISLQEEQITSRAKIQQVLESYFDVDACFVRYQELDRLLNEVRLGYSTLLQGAHGAGKTALLKQLQMSCQQDHISYSYVDFSVTEAQLQATLWRNIVIALTNTDPGMIRFEDVEKYLETVPLVSQAAICLDNIDAFARNPRILFEHEMLQVRALSTHHAPKLKLSIILTANDDFNARNYHKIVGSPWFTNFSERRLETLSERRAIDLLAHAGIIDDKPLSYCINKTKKLLPLDLLLMAYILKVIAAANVTDDKLAETVYLRVEPLLRE